VLCLIHCLALPVLIAFAPVLLQNLPGDDATHRTLAVVIGFVGFLAFRSGYKVHRRRWMLWLFSLGLLLISVAAALGGAVLTGYGEAAITVVGGILLVTAHLFNHSFCRSCIVEDCNHSCSTAGARNAMTSASGVSGDLP
jgi:peptidoglycan/LPS O-acetylase OafA/YrhL